MSYDAKADTIIITERGKRRAFLDRRAPRFFGGREEMGWRRPNP